MCRPTLVLLLCLLVGCSSNVETSTPTPSQSAEPPPIGAAPRGATEEAQVVDVVDGDTIKVRMDGTVYSLRYIGMDTPERDEQGARMATRANARLVADQAVVLEKDVSETDRFGRLLRYLWVRDGGGWLLVNRELVRLGVAEAKAYPPDTAYQRVLERAEKSAKKAKRGIWANGGIRPLVPPASTPKPRGSNCDPSYPGVCIPPPPPDLDCGDIAFQDFRVRPPDPHGFDSEGDGLGCESQTY